MQQSGAKREMGVHRFQMGGQAPLAPPLVTALTPYEKFSKKLTS